jgi:hypothetical protein
MSEAAKRGCENRFFDYVFGFFAWHFPVSAEIKEAPLPHRKHIMSCSPLRPRFHFRSFADSPVDRPTQEHRAFVDGQS